MRSLRRPYRARRARCVTATGIGGLNYDAAHDLGRTTIQVGRMPDHVEQLTIDIDAAEEGGVLEVMWGDTRAWTPIRVSRATQSR